MPCRPRLSDPEEFQKSSDFLELCGRGRRSAPERKDVGHGKDDEEVAWNDVPNYQQTGNPSGAWGYGPSTK